MRATRTQALSSFFFISGGGGGGCLDFDVLRVRARGVPWLFGFGVGGARGILGEFGSVCCLVAS